MENYYVVLGISKGANLDKIKKAYRKVVKKYHPDVSQPLGGNKRFLEIRDAYETLSNETKRKQYDAELEKEGSSLRIIKVPEIITQRTYRLNEIESLFSSSVDDLLEGFLPGFFDIDKGRIKRKELYYEAILSPSEAANGGIYPVTIPVLEPCPQCSKSGLYDNFFCPICNGNGRIHSERGFSLSIPTNVKHGTEVKVSLEDLGLKDAYLNVVVYVDIMLDALV
jgi:molecular chaperone DnaJ